MSPDDFNHRTERLSTGNTYRFIDEGDKYGSTTLLLIHGFPDFSYGWRHQIKPWASKGWRVVAPDMLGYGGTVSNSFEAIRFTDELISSTNLMISTPTQLGPCVPTSLPYLIA
jgi:pimeloyl-ACP methyl ester carboxylesterase